MTCQTATLKIITPKVDVNQQHPDKRLKETTARTRAMAPSSPPFANPANATWEFFPSLPPVRQERLPPPGGDYDTTRPEWRSHWVHPCFEPLGVHGGRRISPARNRATTRRIQRQPLLLCFVLESKQERSGPWSWNVDLEMSYSYHGMPPASLSQPKIRCP